MLDNIRIVRRSTPSEASLRRWSLPPVLVLGTAMALLAGVAGCWGTSRATSDLAESAVSGHVVVVFIDRSTSTRSDRGIYEQALSRIVDSIGPGDRLIVSPITDRSAADFNANIDREFPKAYHEQTLADNDLVYRKRHAAVQDTLRAIKDSARAVVAAQLSAPSKAPRSAILESMSIAEQIFASEKRKKDLVILSDMMEDSQFGDFGSISIQEIDAPGLIAKLKVQGLLPDLHGVNVYVAGAPAGSPRAAAVARFWAGYFKAAGALMPPGQYARTLLSFTP